MKRYILTGPPGAGKTAILRQLELDGFSVVEEAAADVIALSQANGIAEPWTHPEFLDEIVRLQQARERRAYCVPDPSNFTIGRWCVLRHWPTIWDRQDLSALCTHYSD